ncbi:MAG TPA: TonB family protein, partial [Polyangiaceae bacterium]
MSPRSTAACALFALALIFTLGARAAENSAQAELTPPTPLSVAAPEYPKGSSGNAVVILELVINPSGEVQDARVVDGEEPFATAAVQAARAWRFEPARRKGQPVAARIRFEVRFNEPTPAPTPTTPTETEPTPPASKTRGAPTEELVVTVPGKRLEPGVSSFSRAEVRQLPGAFGDPFRALEALPGVTPVFSGLPYFYVRGAPPGNVGYFLDDIEVPLLYHFALGPSVVNPAMVDRVDLFPGAYPARYGRFAGAILAAKTLPPEHRFHGETTIRIFDAGGVVEAPFAERRGAALVGGRYSYTALALSLLAPGVDLQYWDYQARVAFAVGRHDTLTLFGFGSYDYLGQRGETGFSTQFHRVSLRADHAVSKNTDVRVSAAVGLDRTATGDLFGVRDRSGALRTDIDHRVSRTAELRVGSDITLDAYDIRLNPNSTSSDTSDPTSRATGETLFPTRLDTASGLWADVVLKPEPGVSVTPGLRFDYYSSNGFATVGVDPRISTRIELSRRLSVVHTLGLAHQPPSFIVPIPGFSISGLDSGLQESVQASSGIEADLFAHITGTLTVFDAIFLNMTDPLSSGEIERYLDRTQGSAVGLEFSLRRPFTE